MTAPFLIVAIVLVFEGYALHPRPPKPPPTPEIIFGNGAVLTNATLRFIGLRAIGSNVTISNVTIDRAPYAGVMIHLPPVPQEGER